MTFARWQPRYAEHGVALIPCSPEKQPLVEHPQLFGCRGSTEIAAKPKFANAAAFGFYAGERSRLTVLDVDTTDERVLADALARHGETPMLVRTASGKAHGYYRFSGERRRIRPWNGLPIDLLGAGGLVVAPPTVVAKGEYQFVQGGLDDLSRLPTMSGLDPSMYVVPPSLPESVLSDDWIIQDNEPTAPDYIVPDGRRGDELWHYCMRSAHNCGSFDMLLDMALKFNTERCIPPMEDERVIAGAASAWQYTERGLNRFSQHGSWLPVQEVNELITEPSTLLLLTFLKANNGPDAEFMISNGLAEGPSARLRMNLRALRQARDRLIELGYIYRVRAAIQNRPALYRWRLRRPIFRR
jgi:hypothetical protein